MAPLSPGKSVLDRWHPEMGSQQLRNVGRSLLWVRPGNLPLRDPGLWPYLVLGPAELDTCPFIQVQLLYSAQS